MMFTPNCNSTTVKTLEAMNFQHVVRTPEGPVFVWCKDVRPGKQGYEISDPVYELSCLIGLLTRNGMTFTPAHELRATYGREYIEALDEEAATILTNITPPGYIPHVGAFGSGLYPEALAK